MCKPSTFAAALLLVPLCAFAQGSQGHAGAHPAAGGHAAFPEPRGFGGEAGHHHVPPPPHLADHWHEGHWYHGDHFHRGGWWWVTGDEWFWYAEPVYPYPDFYLPPQVLNETPPTLPPAQYWYYCEQPAGYYPYVSRCDVPWQPVVATPPPSPPPANREPP